MGPTPSPQPNRRRSDRQPIGLSTAAVSLCGATVVAGLATAWLLLGEWSGNAGDPGKAADAVALGVWGAALLGQVWLLRRLFDRVGGLGRIGSALDAWAGDEPDAEAMRVARDSPTAHAWNRLIDQLAAAKDRAEETYALDRLTASASPGETDRALDALPHGVVVLDPELTLVSVNGAACRLLMRSRDRLLGAPAVKVVPDEKLRRLIERTVRGDEPRGGSLELNLHPEEEQSAIVRVTVRPLGDGPGRGALAVLEDVTQQRAADQSRNLFVAQATHELRTPLTNIGLYVERAIDLDDHETADRARCLNVINQEVVRLGRVVEEVLSVSEIEAGSFSVRRDDVKLDELVRRIEGEYREQAQEKQLRIAFDLPPKLPTIQGDREKIAVALHNLVGNAIKYTPAGGEVRVELTETLTDLEFRVTDTGIGIDESELSKVFEKFYRADDQRLRDIGGSGLGLALAREVIRLHGGDITAESVLNQGSTFTLRLPLAGVPAQGS